MRQDSDARFLLAVVGTLFGISLYLVIHMMFDILSIAEKIR